MNKRGHQNQERFLKLLMLNDKGIYIYILSIIRNASDADDIMQETTAVMWRKFSNFTVGMDFTAWGMTIARYQMLSYFKKQKNSKVRYSENLTRSIEQEVKEAIPGMEDRLDALKNCVKKLDDSQRNLLKMRYEEGITIKNIGAYISKSTSTAFYSLSIIHKLLFQCVRRTLGEELI
jgi:RNA polymerase sigma-70 factor (ECF subfamily)